MNNYCTNCGKKLVKDELVCKACNTPIIDLPYNYDYKPLEEKARMRKILIIIGIGIVFVIAFYFAKGVISRIKISKMQKEYIEPYLKENYSNLNYSIKYDLSGKCIISGNCYFDPVMGCDGGSCQEYEYLDENDCKSYYYFIKSDTTEFILTVVEKNNQFSVVEGRNIYGKNKENYGDTSSNDIINNESNYNINRDDESVKIIIDKYPYESGYNNFKSTYKNNQIYLDNNSMIMNFSTGILSNNSKLYISGNITNPMYFKGNIFMTTKYYNRNYNEIGICNETIKLLGKGYSNISFSCHISESELADGKNFEDVVYYKINISSLDINE